MRKALYLFLVISLGCILSWIPQVGADRHTDTEVTSDDEIVQLPEITVTATRAVKSPYKTPNAITVLDQEQFERSNAEHASNLLQDVVGVIAQETTVGQGSPMLRGLTGYQTVIQIDWVRLNNATFRSGPNQYTATIAPGNDRTGRGTTRVKLCLVWKRRDGGCRKFLYERYST